MNRATVALTVAATLLAAAPSAIAQGIDSNYDIQRIRDATPSCDANPDARWIGRVSGNTTDILDNSRPVSFVGCFDDQATCELWKGRASSIITSTIIQYSCRQR